ncbi:MAG: YIP1 family protein [Melioribacteraceae bacterium]|nr:YIP1 family protein [Melioribacteraceae bacterium]
MNCTKCGAILRSRVVNIDLWSTIWQLVEFPRKAFENIVHAEHKNFIVFLVLLAGVKVFIISNFISNLILPSNNTDSNTLLNILISLGYVPALLFIIAVILKFILRLLNVNTRIKDNFSILIYANVPLILALLILFPIEYGIFGGYWISFNPSPFLIKFNSALIISGLELLFLIWQVILVTTALYVQTRSILFSIFAAIIVDVFLIAGVGFFIF